jgi:hypothetical protein
MSDRNGRVVELVVEAQRLEEAERSRTRESMDARDAAAAAWLSASRLLHAALRAGLKAAGWRQSESNDMYFWVGAPGESDGFSFWAEVHANAEARGVTITARHNHDEAATFCTRATEEEVFAASYRFAVAYNAFTAAHVPAMPDLSLESASEAVGGADDDNSEQTNIGQDQKSEPTPPLQSSKERGLGGTRRVRGAAKAARHSPAPKAETVPAPDLFPEERK